MTSLNGLPELWELNKSSQEKGGEEQKGILAKTNPNLFGILSLPHDVSPFSGTILLFLLNSNSRTTMLCPMQPQCYRVCIHVGHYCLFIDKMELSNISASIF